MNATTKMFLYKASAILMLLLMLFAALPAAPAGATSLTITSAASGTWEATAWPRTTRSGTINVTVGNTTVTGTGTAFLTELSVGNILRTTTNLQIGTVASIASNTSLTLVNVPATTRTNIAYTAQGVGPADNAVIDATHTVTIAAKPVNQTGTVTVNAGGTLVVSNTATVFSTLTVNGTVNGMKSVNFGTLTINSGGVLNAGTAGSYTAASVLVKNGATLNISRAFTVSGTTTIGGTVNFSSTTVTARAMVFGGPVTLQSSAEWNEPTSGNGANNSYDFQHNLTNNASLFVTSNSSVHTFSGAGKAINGSTNTAIARVRVTGTYTNNGILSAGINLTGTGALTNSAAGTLNAGGTVSITTLTNAGTMNKTNGGPITTALANFVNTGTLNLNGTGTVTGLTNGAGGTVNLNSSGLIDSFDNATATSRLNIFDLTPVPHFTNLIVTAPGNTVDYSGAGMQTVKPIIYSNLIFSGSGDKAITMPNGSTLTTGTLSIAPTGTAKANITGPNLVVDSLKLGGFGKINGTWGSTSSAASNTDDNFFAATTGYLNVTTDARLAQTITFTSTPPANAAVGGTYTPTATGGGSGNPVVLAIDASATSVCSLSGAIVSFDAVGTCIINANQAGNDNYKAAPQAQQSFTINPPPASVQVFIAGTEMPGSPFTVSHGTSVRKSFAGIDKGPVEITGNENFFAAERVIHKVNGTHVSFAEMMGLPDSQLDTLYWLPWYNNVNLNTQLRIANPSTSQQASVAVSIGGTPVPGSPFTIGIGGSIRKTFTGIDKGPVKIDSNIPVVAAERVIYKVNGVETSFTEMMAMPNSQLDTLYWLPWYNNVNLNTQLRIANPSTSQQASVSITIGGTPVPGSPFTIGIGGSIRKTFTGIDKGPVKIESNIPVVAAERVIYKVNGVDTSFTEMMALPDSLLDLTFWFPWYNNVNLDTQLRFGVP